MIASILGFSVACGGVSVAPRAHLQQVCDAAGPIGAPFLLPVLAVPVREVPHGRPVYVSATEVEVDFDLLDEGGLAGAVTSVLKQPGAPEAILVVGAEAPVTRVRAVLDGFAAAGVPVRILVQSETPVSSPPFPDPAYADELRTRLSSAEPSMRMVFAAQEIEGLLTFCPSAGQAFSAVAMASADMKCPLLAQGLEESLPSCPLTDGDKVVTAVQLMMSPPDGQNVLTLLDLTLDPDGEPLELGEATWGDVAAKVAALDGQKVSLPPL